LIQQTEIHFRQYAKQQFPDSPQQVHLLTYLLSVIDSELDHTQCWWC